MKVDIMKHWRSSIVLVIVALALLGSSTMAFAHDANPGVFPINSRPYGLTYGQWSARWWQFAFQQPDLDICAADKPGSKVVFLAGTPGDPVKRSCTVRAGQAIMFPVFNVEWSVAEANKQACPAQASPSGSSDAALQACATAQANHALDQNASLEAAVDHVKIQNLERFRAVSPPFNFTTVAGNPFELCPMFGDCPLTSRAVADGFWIILKPLSPGKHTIHFAASVPFFPFKTDTTYHITVC
jgi:hypothetical protein